MDSRVQNNMKMRLKKNREKKEFDDQESDVRMERKELRIKGGEPAAAAAPPPDTPAPAVAANSPPGSPPAKLGAISY